jgi:translation elongation factor EF-Tu-like GTPase
MAEKFEEGKLIGKITHYFDKIGVGVIELSDKLKVGDIIRIVGGEVDFDQTVDSIQIERKEIKEGKKGDSVGLKLNQKVHDGYRVYKV